MDTSWGGVADWYDDLLKSADTYQSEVVLPNIIRLINPHKGQQILDLACGQGYFSLHFAKEGAQVTGVDISPELIQYAREAAKRTKANVSYEVSSAEKLPFLKNDVFDVASIVLAIQNIEHYAGTFSECGRVLKQGGSLIIVLNHPCFRIPKSSSWGFDEKGKSQYRRLDSYMSESRTKIDMNPSVKAGAKENTVSFHRPLQSYFKALEKAGFVVARVEEWISHKKSQSGPRQAAEDRARKEFPLFMTIVAIKK
jgi:ubiquinone/menaquinone biosynthesis C-methylase UbiE